VALVFALTLHGEPAQAAPPPESLRALAVRPPLPADPTNRYADDPRAARFGQRLFFEPRFSGALLEGDNDGSSNTLGLKGETGRVSCAGCHVPAAGFSDNRSLGQQASLAAGWTLRRTPSLLDVGRSRLLHWDGRHDAFWNQIFGPLEHSNEMNSARLFVAEQVFRLHRKEYEALFGAMPPLGDGVRFPQLTAERAGCKPQLRAREICHGVPGDGAEYDGLSPADQLAVTRVVVNLGKAVEAYLRKLSCGRGRFDAWVAGDESALSEAERRGALLFTGKAGCVSCHTGPTLSDERFHNVGLFAQTVSVIVSDAGDLGASVGLAQSLADPLNAKSAFSDAPLRSPSGFGAAGLSANPPASEGSFRTPKLRCVSARPSFMHTAQLRTLDEVVAFFDRGGHPFGYPGKSELKPLGLSAQERADLVAFLKSLDGPGPERLLLTQP